MSSRRLRGAGRAALRLGVAAEALPLGAAASRGWAQVRSAKHAGVQGAALPDAKRVKRDLVSAMGQGDLQAVQKVRFRSSTGAGCHGWEGAKRPPPRLCAACGAAESAQGRFMGQLHGD